MKWRTMVTGQIKDICISTPVLLECHIDRDLKLLSSSVD